jgi:recombination protein RecA
MSKIKLASKKELMDRIISKIHRCQPETEVAGTFEAVRSKGEVLAKIKYVITTGIKPFDDLVGGMPVGKVIELFGLESCGKTNLVVRTCVRAQMGHVYERIKAKNGLGYVLKQLDRDSYDLTILYMDNENSLSDQEKKMVDGVEMDAILSDCDTVDQLFKIIDITVDTAIEEQEATKRLQLVIVVVDTIASTSSKKEITQEWGVQDYPRQAQELRSAFRQMVRKIRRHNVCFIGTNQASDKFKQSGGSKKKRPGPPTDADFVAFGGKALKFYSTHRIFMEAAEGNYKLTPKAKFAAAFLVKFRSVKNRLLPPLREGRMVLMFGNTDRHGEVTMPGGFNAEFSLLETLISLGFAEFSKEGTGISFKFNKHGIETSTFETKEIKQTLEEQDDAEPADKKLTLPARGRKDPRITCRAEWPKFYKEHAADVDRLWEAAVAYAFTLEALPGDEDEDADVEELAEEES